MAYGRFVDGSVIRRRMAEKDARMNAALDRKFGFPKPERETAAVRSARKALRRAERQASPTGQAADKRKADRAEERHRLKIKRQVWRRSSLCECCGDSEQETAQKSHVSVHEMHEVRPRSLTMNAPAEERFSLANCMRVCRPCHSDLGMRIGGRKLLIQFHDATLGASGDYDICDFASGHILRHMRRAIEDRARTLSIDESSPSFERTPDVERSF